MPTTSTLSEKSGASSFSSAPSAHGTDRGRRVPKVFPSGTVNKNRGGSGCSTESVDAGPADVARKKHRIQRNSTSSSLSHPVREERLSDRDRKENPLLHSSYAGGVEVAIRVRPLVKNEIASGENLCVAVFSADNRKAQQRVTSVETIPLWNASDRAQRETIGGPHTTLRLLHRIVPREIGVERSVLNTVASPSRSGFPTTPHAQTRESWWSQHLMTTSTVSSSTSTSNEHIIKDFHFPIVLGPRASQRDVYDHLRMHRYCNAAYDGKAAAVLCFGQTGSGKTYTMSGAPAAEAVEPVMASEDKWGSTAQQDKGQTGATTPTAGETYDTKAPRESSESAEDNDGVQYRAVSFFMGERLKMAKRAGKQVRIQASYVEVYNEKINDLLQGRNNLPLHYHKDAQLFFVEGLMMVDCENESDVHLVLQEGQRHRQRAAHMLNDNSSRSHTIFTLYVEVKDQEEGKASSRQVGSEMFDVDDDESSSDEQGEGSGKATRTHGALSYRKKKKKKGNVSTTVNGKLSFVDLAGAERLKETQSEGEDAKSINKSLFALGSVLEKLSQQQQKSNRESEPFGVNGGSALGIVAASTATTSASCSSFIPYRSSVLTKLLMDTLSGTNCSALLFIACITPGERFYLESIKTLYYAQRASDAIPASPPSATVGATGKMSAESSQIFQLTQRVQALEKENRIFREALRLPIRGILGEENIRRQVHQLIQQRGTGQNVSSTVSLKHTPPRPAVAVHNDGEEEVPLRCGGAVDTIAALGNVATTRGPFPPLLSPSFSSPPSSVFSAADTAVAAGACHPTRNAPSLSFHASSASLLEKTNKSGSVPSPSSLHAPSSYASTGVPPVGNVWDVRTLPHDLERKPSRDDPSHFPPNDLYTRMGAAVCGAPPPHPIPICRAASIKNKKETNESGSDDRNDVEIVVEINPDSDDEGTTSEEKRKERDIRSISDTTHEKTKTDDHFASGAPWHLRKAPHEEDSSSAESAHAALLSSSLPSSSLIAARDGGTSFSPPIRNALETCEGFETVERTMRECTSRTKNVNRNHSEMRMQQSGTTRRDVLLPFTGVPPRRSLLPTPSRHPSASFTAVACCRGSAAEGRKISEQKFANQSALPPPPSALVAKAPGGRSAMDILNDLPDR